MPFANTLPASRRRLGVLAVAAVALSGCAVNVKPTAHAGSSSPTSASRGRVDDPRTTNPNHLKCLEQQHLPIQQTGATTIQVGPLPAGPTIVFTPTSGTAQGDQIRGVVQGAEVIGSALLYPNSAPDPELKLIEDCLTQGVKG